MGTDTEGLEVVAYMSYMSGAVYRADDPLTERFGVPPGAAPLVRQSDALALAERAREEGREEIRAAIRRDIRRDLDLQNAERSDDLFHSSPSEGCEE